MGFSRQECWSGLPLPPPGDLPGLGIEPESLALQVNLLPSGATTEALTGPHTVQAWGEALRRATSAS